MLDRAEEIEIHNAYALANNRFYAPMEQLALERGFLDRVEKKLPPEWRIHLGAFWATLNPPYELTDREWVHEGTKLHLSTRPEHLNTVFDNIFPILYDRMVPFKFVADEFRFYWQNSKASNRLQSGKFLTVYPANQSQFDDLAETLHAQTSELGITGPAILSDNCYRVGAPVYYRFGSFVPRKALTTDGRTETLVGGQDGEMKADKRSLFGIAAARDDPEYETQLETIKEGILIGGRYKVQTALSFSNAGGVYLCINPATGSEVVIKEARRNTNFWSVDGQVRDAVDILKHEARVLASLDGLEIVPNLIEYISDGGHGFLVMEQRAGIGLNSLPADERFIISQNLHDLTAEPERLLKILEIVALTIEAVSEVHSRGVVLADISPNNVLYDPATNAVTLIDFESSILPDSDEESAAIAAYWGTGGFRTKGREQRRSVGVADDWYGVSRLLLHLITPVTPALHLSNDIESRVWRFLMGQGIPISAYRAARYLQRGQPERALELLQDPANSSVKKAHVKGIALNDNGIHRMVSGIAQSMHQRLDTTGNQAIWPGHCLVHETNPLSLEHGACGPLLFLQEATETVPSTALDWIKSASGPSAILGPGLYLGWAGIAYTYAHLGNSKECTTFLQRSSAALDTIKDPSIQYGLAGIGLAGLRISEMLGSQMAHSLAGKAAKRLMRDVTWDNERPCWASNKAAPDYLGFAQGRAGIALFLLQYGASTGDQAAKELGEAALDADLAEATTTQRGPEWPRIKGERILLPYFFAGSAGIAAVCLRAYRANDRQQYLEKAIEIADACFSIHTFNPGLHSGLAGIGELMLDLYQETSQPAYLTRARQIAEGIGIFRVEENGEVLFPGRWLSRLSHDFGTGSAGIGTFLLRLLKKTPRLILDR